MPCGRGWEGCEHAAALQGGEEAAGGAGRVWEVVGVVAGARGRAGEALVRCRGRARVAREGVRQRWKWGRGAGHAAGLGSGLREAAGRMLGGTGRAGTGAARQAAARIVGARRRRGPRRARACVRLQPGGRAVARSVGVRLFQPPGCWLGQGGRYRNACGCGGGGCARALGGGWRWRHPAVYAGRRRGGGQVRARWRWWARRGRGSPREAYGGRPRRHSAPSCSLWPLMSWNGPGSR